MTRPLLRRQDTEQEIAANDSRVGVSEESELDGAGFMAGYWRYIKTGFHPTHHRAAPQHPCEADHPEL